MLCNPKSKSRRLHIGTDDGSCFQIILIQFQCHLGKMRLVSGGSTERLCGLQTEMVAWMAMCWLIWNLIARASVRTHRQERARPLFQNLTISLPILTLSQHRLFSASSFAQCSFQRFLCADFAHIQISCPNHLSPLDLPPQPSPDLQANKPGGCQATSLVLWWSAQTVHSTP